jgi:hypothetical protein
MKQTEDKPKEQVKEPTLPVFIPMRVIRWLLYSIGFALLSVPFIKTDWQGVCAGLVLGHFASQLNALINKKP